MYKIPQRRKKVNQYKIRTRDPQIATLYFIRLKYAESNQILHLKMKPIKKQVFSLLISKGST